MENSMFTTMLLPLKSYYFWPIIISSLYQRFAEHLKQIRFFLFAGNTNIYFESDDLLTIEQTVNDEMKKYALG